MSIDRIRELLKIMEDHDLAELEMEDGDFRVKLGKHRTGSTFPHQMLQATPAVTPPAADTSAPAADAVQDEGLETITSPIVGTFYRAPSPESDPYVVVGDSVNEKSIVCIVEAMKVMNEINAGVNGKIEKILVENGEAVEYGQPLFLVKPV